LYIDCGGIGDCQKTAVGKRRRIPSPIDPPRCAIVRPMKRPSTYILASKRDGILYVGVTSNLWNRMAMHTQHLIEGFTSKYNVTQLVYYEFHDTMDGAIAREKQLKDWRRAWKINLIGQMNPEWTNLYDPDTGEIADGPFDRINETSTTVIWYAHVDTGVHRHDGGG